MTITTTVGSSNQNNITPPRVPFLDARTGLISREWFMWLLNMFARANAGAEVAEVVDYLALAPTAGGQVGTDQAGPDYLGPAPFTPNPVTGALISVVESGSLTTQQIPNTDYVVTFDVDTGAYFGSIKRAGNHFYTSAPVLLIALMEPQIQQNNNNKVTYVWLTVDGVPVPGSGIVFEAAAAGDSSTVLFSHAGIFKVGQILQIHATCSDNNGSSLLYTPPSGFRPGIPAMKIVLQGFSI